MINFILIYLLISVLWSWVLYGGDDDWDMDSIKKGLAWPYDLYLLVKKGWGDD